MARTWKPIAVGVVMALAGASMLVSAQQPAADLILTNGKIITVDDKFSIAQAVAVRGDRIVAVGTNEEVNQLAGPDTRRIDLEGKSVTPGIRSRAKNWTGSRPTIRCCCSSPARRPI